MTPKTPGPPALPAMGLNDRRLAVELQNLIDRRLDLALRTRLTQHRYGVVFGVADTVARTVAVRLYGLPDPSPGFHYGSGLAPRDGDHVRVYIDPRGDKWIDDIQGRDAISEIVDVVTPPVIQPDRALGSIARIPVLVGGQEHFWSGIFDIHGDQTSVSPGSALLANSTLYHYSVTWTDPDDTLYARSYGIQSVPSAPLAGIGSNGVLRVDRADGGGADATFTATGSFTTPDAAHFNASAAVYFMSNAAQLSHDHGVHGTLAFWVDPDGWTPIEPRLILEPAPEAIDVDDATYHLLSPAGTDQAEAIRLDLGAAYRIVRARIVIGCATAGAKSYELRGANAGDYSDEVTLATMAFTAAGAYATNTLTPVWPSTTPYRFYRIVGPAETRRIFTVELYETTAGDVPVIDPTTGDGALIDAALAAVLAAIITDHGALTGLADDDHPQYTSAAELAAYAQPLDADLTAISAIATAAFGRSVLTQANAGALRTLAGLVIGTDVQAYDPELAAIAGLASAADRVPYFTGSGTAALAALSPFIRTLLDDADAASARATLGVATTYPQPLVEDDGAGSFALVFEANGEVIWE